jgi:hypothetical protein
MSQSLTRVSDVAQSHPMTSAEKRELPNARPGRAAVIAAIHALAEWLAEHPEVPSPQAIELTHTTYQEDEVDEPIRMAAVIDWARANDAKLFESPTAVHAALVIMAAPMHGVRITYDRMAFKDTVSRKYVDERAGK